jgi:hypothetical protein
MTNAADDRGSPLTPRQVIEKYFIEHRAKLIDVAAFLDRIDRAADTHGTTAEDDFRLHAFRCALDLLTDGRPQRVRRVLELLSDRSVEPIASAAGLKGAHGAPPPTL